MPEPDGMDPERISLCCSRKSVADINGRAIAELPDPGSIFEGKIQGDFPEDILPTKLYLQIKYGEKVMLLANKMKPGSLCGEFEYVNGDVGIVEGYDHEAKKVTVRLKDDRIVTITPARWSNYEYVVCKTPCGKVELQARTIGQFN